MPFTLPGLVGRNLQVAHDNVPGSQLIDLPQDFQLVPLTVTLLRTVASDPMIEPVSLDDGHSAFLTRLLTNTIGKLQSRSFSYLEISCEGGSCFRSAAVFSAKALAWTASQEDFLFERLARQAFSGPDAIRATNVALRLLGVERSGDDDELASLGLTRPPYRSAWDNFDRFSL